jgi:hypothetical protein
MKPTRRSIPLFLPALGIVLSACSGDSSSGNRPPSVTILAPFTGASFLEGEAVELEGTASDPEDGALAGTSLEWSSDRDGALGTGESRTVLTLTTGTHGIELSATDSRGRSTTAVVHVRVVPGSGLAPRAGEVNPYAGRLQRTPAKLDDELILVGRSSTLDETALGIVDVPIDAYEGPSSAPTEPRITTRLAGTIPVAAAAGRPLGSNLHQAAILLRTSGAAPQFALELVGLDDPGEDRIAVQPFQPLFPDGPLDVAVADLDAFEEEGGEKALLPPADVNAEYHDEVVVASADLLNGDLVARVDVLSFESVWFPEEGATPFAGATSITTTWTTQPMHPASRIVVRHGDALVTSVSGPQLLVAYVDAQSRVAIDVYEYVHTRPDPQTPDPSTDVRSLEFVLHAILSSPLDAAAIAAGGWDVEVGAAVGLGMDMVPGDVVLLVHNDGGAFVQEAWILDGLQSPGPQRLGEDSGEFARVPDGSGGEIGLSLLPDARVRISLGRIVDELLNRCEALGIFVLADTDRGAVVQSLTAFVDDPFVGSYRFGPVNEAPAWPHQLVIQNHPLTSATTKTSLVAGGFVSVRNALIDDRGNPAGIGTEFAMDCDNVNSAPLLGPMPSFYVADPEAAELHAVTMPLGIAGIGSTVTTSMDSALDERAILLAADTTGDAAYYGSFVCAGDGSQLGDCTRLFLGDAELHYAIEDIETANVLLGQPPKHVDHLPELGGIVDVSMQDGFYAEFVQTDQASGSVTRKTKTDWSIGARVELGLGPPAPKNKEFSSIFEMSLDAEHRSVQEQFTSSQVALSLTQTAGAVDDDVVWSKRQTIDYWRFAAQGGKPADDPDAASGLPDDAYMEVAIPDQPETLIGPGRLNEAYQPAHMVGNILSYPTFGGDADDLGELFGFLGSYIPSDASGTRSCKPLENGDPEGCLVLVNGALQRVAEVLAGDEFVGGEFQSLSNPIDVADVLQVGGIAYSAELEFETTVKNGLSVTNNDTIKAETNLKIPLESKLAKAQIGQLETQLRASASFENSRVSENSIGSKAKVALHLPSGVPVERSYQIRPSFGFTPGGSLQVSYQVNTDGTTSTFWTDHYSAPDPALNLPFRIVRTSSGFKLGTDSSRDQIKGFFVRDGEGLDPARPGESQGDLVTEVPRDGDPLQLEVRVTNLSVGAEAFDVQVLFTLQEYRNGTLVGAEVPIGMDSLDFLPYRGEFPGDLEGHVGSAFLVWDTTGFGPDPSQAFVTYRVRVTLDPDDRIPGERHELRDRYGDPLLGPTGNALDPGLEKGQNNTGWSLVRIAPPESQALRAAGAPGGKASSRSARRERVELRLAGATDRGRVAPILGRVLEPVGIGLELRSEQPVLDYGLLQVFDGDPVAGAPVILSRTVQGTAPGGVLEELVWRPETPGRRVLHAVYSSTVAGVRETLQIPVIVEP